MRNKGILIIDDDSAVRKYLSALLTKNNFQPLAARIGEEGLEMLERENPVLVLLDILMPGLNGIEALRRIREWSQVPVIMVSTVTSDSEKVLCLDRGADDYITKPFGAEEMMARIRAVLRRSDYPAESIQRANFIHADVEVDFNRREVYLKGKQIQLTPTEYSLLRQLVINAGKVLEQKNLLHSVWGPEYSDERQYLHVFIGRLRQKIELDPGNPRYILTIPAVGYQFSLN